MKRITSFILAAAIILLSYNPLVMAQETTNTAVRASDGLYYLNGDPNWLIFLENKLGDFYVCALLDTATIQFDGEITARCAHMFKGNDTPWRYYVIAFYPNGTYRDALGGESYDRMNVGDGYRVFKKIASVAKHK